MYRFKFESREPEIETIEYDQLDEDGIFLQTLTVEYTRTGPNYSDFMINNVYDSVDKIINFDDLDSGDRDNINEEIEEAIEHNG